MLKKLTLLLLITVMMCFCCVSFSASAKESTMDILEVLCEKYPAGKYWNHSAKKDNNPDGVTDTPCAHGTSAHGGSCSWTSSCLCNKFDRSTQCMGYAHKIAYDICGKSPRDEFTKITKLNAEDLRVGDVIRYRGNRHSLCVVGVKGDKIAFTDANWDHNCGIRWGVMDISDITGFTYVLHLEGNSRKNTDLDFFEKAEDENPEQETTKPDEEKPTEKPSEKPSEPEATVKPEEEKDDCEIWKTSKSAVINVRKKHDITSEIVGKIKLDSEFEVTEKYYDGTYLWGKVSYGDIKGWSAINYASYVEGSYEKLAVTNSSLKFDSCEGITFKWNKLEGASGYKLYIYDSKKKKIKEYSVSSNSKKISVDKAGTYYVKVSAVNEMVESWSIDSEREAFTTKLKKVALKSISLNKKSLSLNNGSSSTLKVKLNPSNSTQKEFKWTSGNTKVATVSSSGKVTAKSIGTVTITCTSKSDSSIKAKCKVTVKPGKVKISQDIYQTTAKKVVFSWEKLSKCDSYLVYKYNGKKKKYEQVASTTGNYYTHEGLKSQTKYFFIVKGVAKIDGKKVTGQSTKITCYTDPPAVTDIKQSAADSKSVTLKWKKIEKASYYVVYKYNNEKKDYDRVADPKKNKYVCKMSANEKAKFLIYAVIKTDIGYFNSASSKQFTATAGPKTPSVTATAGKKSVKLTWKKIDKATRYDVYRLKGDRFVRIAKVSADKLSYTDKDLKSGKSYTYNVKAINMKSKPTTASSHSERVKVKAK